MSPLPPHEPRIPGRSYAAAPQTPHGAPPNKASPPALPRAPFGAVVAAAPLAVRAAAAVAVPQHQALAPTQGQSAPLFTIQDAQKLAGPNVCRAAANTWIKELRKRMTNACCAVDLEAEGLPWRRWISGLPDLESIVGEGAVAIMFRRLKDWDANTKNWRTDIVVTRHGDMSTRLHPHKTGGAKPIHGCLWSWLSEGDLAIEGASASTGVPRRAASLSAAAASACVPQRLSDAAAAAATLSTKPTRPEPVPRPTDDAASSAAGDSTSVPQRAPDVAACPDAAASDVAARSAAAAGICVSQSASEAAAA